MYYPTYKVTMRNEARQTERRKRRDDGLKPALAFIVGALICAAPTFLLSLHNMTFCH